MEALKKSHRHVLNWIKEHRLLAICLTGLLLVGTAANVAYWYMSEPEPVVISTFFPKPKPKPAAVKYYSPLTGLEVADQTATTQPVTAIMIENSPDARPQSGIKSAGVVFEAIAEGGITRFLTIYQEAKPQLIGPVRSVRLYYVDWLAPFNASVAHIGGSAAALAEVRNGNYRDIDQFFNSKYYWRATDRYAPHNVYTSFEKLDALNKAKGYTTSTFTGFPRADGKTVKTPDATKIALNFSSKLYNTSYDYDKATNSYKRSIGGAPSTDREAGQVTPSVVIAMKVNETTIFEDGNRQSIQTIGSGEADIFQNGTVIVGTWTKSARASQIVFTDKDGKEIPLNRGQTWIGAIPHSGGSVTWQ